LTVVFIVSFVSHRRSPVFDDNINTSNVADRSSFWAGIPPDAQWAVDETCSLEPFNDCTPSGRRWPHEREETPCAVLSGKKLLFIGDSFVRHAYVAMTLLLSGDYQKGALRPSHDQACEYDGQFEENVCRQQLSYSVTTCQGTVTLGLNYGSWPTISQRDLRKFDYIIWGAGNHPVDENYETRYGSLNASVVGSDKLEPTCQQLHSNHIQKIFWLDMHARFKVSPDEQIEKVYQFHRDMPDQLLARCQIPSSRFISSWDATLDLVTNFASDAQNMTDDNLHWGMQVNLLKADQIILAIKESQGSMLSTAPQNQNDGPQEASEDNAQVPYAEEKVLVTDAVQQVSASSGGWELDSSCKLTPYNDCTPSGRRWPHEKEMHPCTLLAGKKLLFIGDSFLRHAYVATALLLSGDYQKGALRPAHDPACEYDGQFEEKVCRGQLSYSISVCDNSVSLALNYAAWPTISKRDTNRYDFIIWGAGNHPVNGDYDSRYGVLNASIVGSDKLEPTCQPLADTAVAKLFWLDIHARFDSIYSPSKVAPDERIEHLYQYHADMPNALLTRCRIPSSRFISPWNATLDLVTNFRSDAENMTYDQMHWGMEVNLLKAGQIIQAIKESMVPQNATIDSLDSHMNLLTDAPNIPAENIGGNGTIPQVSNHTIIPERNKVLSSNVAQGMWQPDASCSLSDYNDCTPSGRRWPHERALNPCSLLAGKKITFVGDSYVRHAYVATVLLLSGDYEKGALAKHYDKACEYEGQFEEKVCRGQLNFAVSVCNGSVRLTHKYAAWPTISKHEIEMVDYVIWGAGNHPVNGDYKSRYGVLNASIVGSEKFAPTCRQLDDTNVAKMFWLDIHVRFSSIYSPAKVAPDERIEHTYQYHADMPNELLTRCRIPSSRFISPWNATLDLITNFRGDAENMTYDQNHWGMRVNLLKADQIIQAIKESMVPSATAIAEATN
jgi:hypothetical protein